MNYKILLCFTLGFGIMSHFVQGMSREQTQKIIQEMNNPALLPARAAANILLEGFFPDFSEGKEMLQKIYRTANIDNGTVGTVIAEAAKAYGERTNRAVPAPDAFQGEDVYAYIENFLIKRDEDQIFIPPNKDEFLKKLNSIESYFADHFGNQLWELLFVDGMTIKRAKMIVKAVSMVHMRYLNNSNKALAAVYYFMKYHETIEKYIFGEA